MIEEKIANAQTIIFNNKIEETSVDFIPKTLKDYSGQKALKERLNIYIKAAIKRDEPLDHILLFGPPGLGKTTLAHVIGCEMNAQIKITSGPVLQKGGDLVAILSSLKRGDILFVDEIHRLPLPVEEILYSAMEQFRIDVILGQGIAAKTISLPVAQFTLIGATTKTGLLSAPLRSRFGISEKFDFYSTEDLKEIILHSAHFFGTILADEAAHLIASYSRGTPRIAKKIMRRIRDYASVNSENHADLQITKQALEFFGILHDGLTHVDLEILRILYTRPNQAPLGLDALAAIVGEDAQTIEDVYEPFLINRGYIERTTRGRKINPIKIFEIAQLLNHRKQ